MIVDEAHTAVADDGAGGDGPPPALRPAPRPRRGPDRHLSWSPRPRTPARRRASATCSACSIRSWPTSTSTTSAGREQLAAALRPAAPGRHPPATSTRRPPFPPTGRPRKRPTSSAPEYRGPLRPGARLRPRAGRDDARATGVAPAGPLVVGARPAALPRLVARAPPPRRCAPGPPPARGDTPRRPTRSAGPSSSTPPTTRRSRPRRRPRRRPPSPDGRRRALGQRRRLLDDGPRTPTRSRAEGDAQARRADRGGQGAARRRLRPDRLLPVHPHRRYVAEHLDQRAGQERRRSPRSPAPSRPPSGKPRIAELDRQPTAGTCWSPPTACPRASTCRTHFHAVVHYDLAWNPTRHDQREGRVDRFGQTRDMSGPSPSTAGQPIDGIVLDVLLHKHRGDPQATRRRRSRCPTSPTASSRPSSKGCCCAARTPRAARRSTSASTEARRSLRRRVGVAPPSGRRPSPDQVRPARDPPRRGRPRGRRRPRRPRRPRRGRGASSREALRALGALVTPTDRRLRAPSPRRCPLGLRDALPAGPRRAAAVPPRLPGPRGDARPGPHRPAVEALARYVLDAALDPPRPTAARPAARGVVRTDAVSHADHAAAGPVPVPPRPCPAADGTRQLVAEDARLLAFTRRPPTTPTGCPDEVASTCSHASRPATCPPTRPAIHRRAHPGRPARALRRAPRRRRRRSSPPSCSRRHAPGPRRPPVTSAPRLCGHARSSRSTSSASTSTCPCRSARAS